MDEIDTEIKIIEVFWQLRVDTRIFNIQFRDRNNDVIGGLLSLQYRLKLLLSAVGTLAKK